MASNTTTTFSGHGTLRKPLPDDIPATTDARQQTLYDEQSLFFEVDKPSATALRPDTTFTASPPSPSTTQPPHIPARPDENLGPAAPCPQERPPSAMPKKVQKAPPASAQPYRVSTAVAPGSLSTPQISTLPSVTETHASPPRLRKTRDRARSNSLERLSPGLQSNRLLSRSTSPQPDLRGRSSSAQPPSTRNSQIDGSRMFSTSGELRPQSRDSSNGSPPPRNAEKVKKRRSWLPGGRSRSNSHDARTQATTAWIMSPEGPGEYNTSYLLKGEKVPELWNETGNVCVFLCAQEAGFGPSFRVPAYVVRSSTVLNEIVTTQLTASAHGTERVHSSGRQSLAAEDAERPSPPPPSATQASAEKIPVANVYIPLLQAPGSARDFDRLIALRNLFAFLTGQPLVGTKKHDTVLSAFLQIAALLREFDFTNFDGSSYGEAVDLAFGFYVDQLGLADVRWSREKTIEALILGEQMKSPELYNEGFAHAVGKYTAILDIKSPLFSKISVSTRNRLERAHLDLLNRQANVNNRLEAFEFPGLFAGIASSTSNPDYKAVRFKEWKNSFGKMRAFVLSYYKGLFGNWPPKARSKKNQFSESGLNRLCLRILYSDLCALYDLLVDRTSLTPRVIDQSPTETRGGSPDPRISALRTMLSEYDQSSPPVLPPIPYDIPKLPSMTAIREDYNELPPKQQAKFDKSIQPHELLLILLKSRNIEIDQMDVPFLQAFKEFEHREAKGCAPQDLVDQRLGYWLFLYVVIQCLPMLVVDAPGLRFTEGVEYFLCEPPQGNLPWMEDAGEVRKVWYEVSGGQNIVELSADVVMFSVEATYHRSHCWQAAKLWEANGGAAGSSAAPGVSPRSRSPAPPPPLEPAMSPLEPPRPLFQQDADPFSNALPSPPADGSRASSPMLAPNLSPRMVPQAQRASPPLGGSIPATGSSFAARQGGHPFRSSIVMGLEPLSLNDLPIVQGMTQGAAGMEIRRSSRQLSAGYAGALGVAPQPQGRVVKSVSVGNLNQLARDSTTGQNGGGGAGGSGERQGSGSTFDDILKGMEKKEKKKRFPF
ncbi:hypothetical protein VTK73DRAFT_7953 [Phialemonium thermophilum]|uniref:DUF8004 domain-containing protein n=1 Tax=Phialemonium thermophilum TaxID=223376 RepID=A0ABR3XS21_9PEZI